MPPGGGHLPYLKVEQAKAELRDGVGEGGPNEIEYLDPAETEAKSIPGLFQLGDPKDSAFLKPVFCHLQS